MSLLTTPVTGIQEGFSSQFNRASVIITAAGINADDIIRLANAVGARYHDGEDNNIVVDDRSNSEVRQVGPELYTERALRASFKG